MGMVVNWPAIMTPNLGVGTVEFIPDHRPPCECHHNLNISRSFQEAQITTEPTSVAGYAALLFSETQQDPRYYLTLYFMALRPFVANSSITYRRVGLIKVTFNARKPKSLLDAALWESESEDVCKPLWDQFKRVVKEEEVKGDNDKASPAQLQIQHFHSMPEPKVLHIESSRGHMDVLSGDGFPRIMDIQIDFLKDKFRMKD
ncbi:hypothetical protein DV737_g655, partial [Chaetothyriales sp. CBS 132003]